MIAVTPAALTAGTQRRLHASDLPRLLPVKSHDHTVRPAAGRARVGSALRCATTRLAFSQGRIDGYSLGPELLNLRGSHSRAGSLCRSLQN